MKNFALLVMMLCASLASFSQEQQNHRPKVGLVLTGGGAKGFAHIGVLKVLEESGVEISYIGGTSMGAVVGGLYAAGYKAKQIDSIFTSTDFDELLKDYIPRSTKNFFGKRNDELYAIQLPFNKFRIGIPTALSKGLYNYNLLARLTDKVRHVRDFNNLPIPFVCVATDIETGQEVLLDHGYLAQAMLASSAFPSLFSPVEVNGRLLIDGGVTNNYPVEEVRKMGADIIIGVDVQDDLKDRRALKDATRILVQISNLEMIEKMKAKIKLTDIYIKPDISDFSVISFDEGKDIIKRGEDAAFAVYEKIKALADPDKPYSKPGMTKPNDSISLFRISTNKLTDYTRAYIIGKLNFKPDTKISYTDLKNGINSLSATENFSAIGYSLEKNGDKDDLNLQLTENSMRTYLKFGLHYDGLYKSGILVNFTNKKTFLKNDVLSADLILGDNLRYNLDYYIDNGFYWSFGFKSKYNQFNRNVSIDFNNGKLLELLGINSLNIDFSDFTNQAYVQTVFAQKFVIGTGIELKSLKISSQTLQNTSPTFEKSNYGSAFGYMKYDSYDNKYFPNHGWYFCGDFQSYLYSTDFTNNFEPFSITKGSFGIAQTLFNKATLRVETEGGFAIGERTIDFFNFTLGGYGFNELDNIKPFYGYDFLSLTADSYVKATFTFDYEFFKKHHLNVAANYANLGDQLFQDTAWISKPTYTGYAVGYGLETIIGPIEVKYSWSPELRKGFTWFSVGFWF
ncbi:patatin-like phospholipase family protein [Flavobacterium sp.]|uniref:patatin-like phospholipase family protein n=1 Tax=Flavobacterium sp. TaxID=239 RepID=UPI002631DDDD|nr:patatin-like phospholipase family protein [Flavobacterium sp.]